MVAWIWSNHSENSNYGRESFLEVLRQNIAGYCQQTFENKKFVDITQQCFALLPHALKSIKYLRRSFFTKSINSKWLDWSNFTLCLRYVYINTTNYSWIVFYLSKICFFQKIRCLFLVFKLLIIFSYYFSSEVKARGRWYFVKCLKCWNC